MQSVTGWFNSLSTEIEKTFTNKKIDDKEKEQETDNAKAQTDSGDTIEEVAPDADKQNDATKQEESKISDDFQKKTVDNVLAFGCKGKLLMATSFNV